MKLKEKRNEFNIEQADLAKRVGTNAPMISCFEHYKCLPTPDMLKTICEVLRCDVLDIYESDEIYIKVTKSNNCTSTKSKESKTYRLTADLPNYAREILNLKNLEKCGYHSLKDFIWHCFKRFEKQLKIIEKEKATKHWNCSMAKENGCENELSQ